jgi:hypothetical protein
MRSLFHGMAVVGLINDDRSIPQTGLLEVFVLAISMDDWIP